MVSGAIRGAIRDSAPIRPGSASELAAAHIDRARVNTLRSHLIFS
jgi:hypothetical protein